MLNPLHIAVKELAVKAMLFSYRVYAIVFFFPILLLAGAVIYVASFFGANGDLAHRCMTHWAKISLALALLRVHIVGQERLNPESPYIFMPNHASFLDILLVLAHVPHNFRFVVKKEFFSIPLFGLSLRSSGQIPMDRKNPWKALKSLRQAADLLKRSISIVVFPEGTRSRNGKIQDFKKALFILPIRSGFPVVPVLIEGTFQALRRGSILLNPVPLKMTFYDPVLADSFEVREREAFAEKVSGVLSIRISQ